MIPVQNIYYMLSYAFQALQAQNYKDLATVKFHNTAELCAAILNLHFAHYEYQLMNPEKSSIPY